MPSPPSRRSQPRAELTARTGALTLALALVAAGGCSSARPPASPTRVAPRFPVELLAPSAFYPLAADAAALAEMDEAYERVLSGDFEAPQRLATNRLSLDPGFHPATVLLGQIELARGAAGTAVESLQAVAGELPRYAAAQVTLAAAAEVLGDIPSAFSAHAAVADLVPASADHARRLQPRALEIAGNRLSDALARGRNQEAEIHLSFLARWAPDEPATWEATRAVASAVGDPRRELAAVRRLATRPGTEGELRERLATLEVEAGDAGAGVRIYQDLARANPTDARLAERLAWATYHFRLQLLPVPVRDLAARAQLTRADLAVLLYWLAPEVRYGRGGAVRIATDILESEQREQIARVLNLGLMDIDETLHKFYPDRAAGQGEALAAVLRLLADRGGVACLQGLSSRNVSRDAACSLAAGCGLIGKASGCLPGGPISGSEAAEVIQRAAGLGRHPGGAGEP